jgi:hypothetical protein
MPDVAVTESATGTAAVPVVWINGVAFPWITCTAIESSLGATPGRAMLQLHEGDWTLSGPITLNAIDWTAYFRPGARVKVTVGEDVVFLGTLLPRQDQGGQDAIVWGALGDEWILSRLPVRGCMVYDAGSVKFFSRYDPVCNPGGAWNCMGASYGGRIWPVFAPRADQSKAYATTDDNFSAELEAGVLTAWTPRRCLQYLRLLMFAERDGWNSTTHYRNLERSARIEWPESAADALSGATVEETRDPLDRKVQTLGLRGSCLSALHRALRAAGTHDLFLQPNADKSRVTFVSLVAAPESPMTIPIFRGGTPIDLNTAFDFELHETAEDVAESVLIQGEPARVEAQFEYDPEGENNTIKPTASDTRVGYFLTVIWGAAEGQAKGEWAKIPADPDSAPSLDADGTGGKPYARSCSRDAIDLARQLYPDVWTEFAVDSTAAYDAGILQGIAGTDAKFDNTLTYPFLTGGRPALPEQLQHLLIGAEYLPVRFPVRVMVYHDDAWRDVPYASGFRAGAASFRLGLAENLDGDPACIYSGSLLAKPWACELKAVRVNMAVPMDHCVQGYAEITEPSELDPSLEAEFNGPLQYFEDGAGFSEHYQYRSRPSAMTDHGNTGETVDSNGITGLLPPGSEQEQADAAAARILAKRRYMTRRTSWRFPGIRLDYWPGTWVSRVVPRQGAADDADYPVDAPVKSIVWDFLKQETHIGGLLSQVPNVRAAAVLTASPSAGTALDVDGLRPPPIAGGMDYA